MNTILTARLIRPLLEIGMMPGGILLVHIVLQGQSGSRRAGGSDVTPGQA
jgi:hypothetical protein